MTHADVLLAGRYRLDGRIALGGMGEVWRAADTVLGRPVAVKLLRAEYAGHPAAMTRFRAEAQRAAALSHPNIAHVYDFGEAAADGLASDGGAAYLVMELVDGPSLAILLAAGPMDPALVMDVLAQAAAGLQAAHTAGLVHRDIKPANLLISQAGVVKITDFGIAHAAGAAPLTQTGMIVGTPAYLAPERAAGASAGPASDLYSLGVAGYECLTGAPPFTGVPAEVAAAHLHRSLPPLPPSVPLAVAAFIAELTAADPAARPASAGAAAIRAGQLRDALRGGATTGQHGMLPPGRAAVLLGGQDRVLLGGQDRVLLGGQDRVLPGGQDRVLPAGQGGMPPGSQDDSPATVGLDVPGGQDSWPAATRVDAPAAGPRGTQMLSQPVPGWPVEAGAAGAGTVGEGTFGDGTVGDGTVGDGTVGDGTVGDGTAQGAPRPGRNLLLAVAGTAVVAGLVGWLLAGTGGGTPAPGQTGSPRPTASTPSAKAPRTVDVSGASLAGQPARAVIRQLRHLGLNPRLAWAVDGGQQPGTVISVRPDGQVPPGSTVIVYAARQPPGHQGNGHGHHGHGGDGGGGGDGNGNNGNSNGNN